MFRTIASLLLFGALSPVSASPATEVLTAVPAITPPALIASVKPVEIVTASGAIVIDAESGKMLYGQAADQRRPIGSLAKLMTAIIILENHALTERVTVPSSVSSIEGNVVRIRPGDVYSVKDLLSALLIASGNDAAHTLALYHSGSTEKFATVMNERAKALGLRNTHFQNPMGFDNQLQHSTPRDLAWLSMYALKNTTIEDLVSKRGATIQDESGEHTIRLFNTNQLLTTHPTHFFGLKTGTTKRAGQCLISLAYTHGRPYILVVLHSADRYQDTLSLFDSLTRAHAYL